ncbi:S9 family peptidase [bacterium SCSIO 12741]|nr:S9 family peptidase [bacterium SCSIO 12741]
MRRLTILFTLFLFSSFLNAQKVMTPELLWKLQRVGSPVVGPEGNYVYFTVRTYDLDSNRGNSQVYRVALAGGNAEKISKEDHSYGALGFMPGRDRLTFSYGGNLWSMKTDGTDEKKALEASIPMSNAKFSPDGNQILFTSDQELKNQNAVFNKEYPNAEYRLYDDLMFRHWDHWTDKKYSHPYVATLPIDESKMTPKDLMPGETFDVPMQPFGGSDDLIWSPDGKQVVYQSKKLNGVEYAQSTNSDLYSYDLATGKTANLTEGRKGYDSHPLFNGSGTHLTWLSMARDGYESDKNDLIIRTLEDGKTYNLTEKWDNTVSSYIWNENGKSLFFLATVNATYHLFELTLPKKLDQIDPAKHIRQITTGDFNYRSPVQVGKHLVCGRQDMNNATELFKVDIKTGEATQLTHFNDELYAQISRGKIEKRWIKTTDGKDMLTWVIYPPNFDPAKKYPTLLYCQGGPQSAVSQFYSFRWNFQLMAAQGYIVVAPNRRGLPGFGTKWNEDISKDWGGQAMRDYLTAIDTLAQESYVDENRLGAIGASYGGYSVYYLAGIHNNRFKTLISHCGLFNLESWYGSTEELFFANWDIGGAYFNNPQPESYQKYSPHNLVENWNTPLLVIHGGRDYRVPDTQGMEAFTAARLKGIKSRFLYFPNEGHWVLSPQNGLIWHREFFRWLTETL